MYSFTREKLYEYFASDYTPEIVDRALIIFAQNGADIDPHGDEFSFEITEQLEDTFKQINRELGKQNRLEQGQPLTAIETQAMSATTPSGNASKFSTHSNPQLMAAMIRLVTEEAIAQGAALSQIKSQVIGKVLEQGDLEIAKSLLGRTQQTSNFVIELANDRDRVKKMIAGYGINQEPDVLDAFLEEVRGNSDGVKMAVKAIAPSQEKEFDLDAFLLEAGK
ncbi:hypothetical protein ACX27_04075 [Nostoc piscinale CENA21]|uniref:Uncharacterized protein n=1 Tax=Nostoc piscinale CENA21 TaxID=224013 RepID=A0A0M3V4I6_9NOSO|nr:hypothetical protein [Nostoc piscinale]ALF52213.1 hypothetical protein ACX27_04075 [Nostoc piscinale CENA21]